MPAQAQTGALANPVYVVQAGDTLWDIARRFGVSLNDLMQANDIVDCLNLALDAIGNSRSAFEKYQGLRVAEIMLT